MQVNITTVQAKSITMFVEYNTIKIKLLSNYVSIRETKSLPTFRRHLKIHYFQSVYPHPAVHLA